MGQLFNRMKNIASSYINDFDLSILDPLDNEDDELKRMIEELRVKNQKNQKQESKEKEFVEPDENVDLTNAFSILGVSSTATNDEIKSAYKKRILEYHPDRVASLGEEIKKLADLKTKQINQAYTLIKEKRGL